MQNANIFVKKIRFFSALLEHVSQELRSVWVGEYTIGTWMISISQFHDKYVFAFVFVCLCVYLAAA